MTLKEFWYADMHLLEVYKISYTRHIAFTAWRMGDYGRIATEIGARNALVTKQSDRTEKWVEYNDPIERMIGAQLTPIEKDKIFREKMIAEQNWLFNR